jgi:hypothetical protein
MMLLHVHIHIALVQPKFAAVIKLLIKGLLMVRHLHLRKLVQEAIISVARLRLVESLIILFLALGANRHSLICRLLIICTI